MKFWPFRSRYYLSGSDWLAQAMHRIHTESGHAGSGSQIVVALAGTLGQDDVANAIKAFCAAFPLLHGRPRRAWHLAPYWSYATDAERPAVPVDCQDIPDPESVHGLLEACANAPMEKQSPYAAFRLFTVAASYSILVFRFDHRLFDARGAELFLDRLIRHLNGTLPLPQAADGIQRVNAAGLTEWRARFLGGRTVVRSMHALKARSIITPPDRGFEKNPVFDLHTFTPEESRTIAANADRRAGYMMLAPYILSQAGRVLWETWGHLAHHGGALLASTSTDLRPPQANPVPLFFNHFAFLNFALAERVGPSPDAIDKDITKQLLDQIKQGLPVACQHAWMLMRILPITVYARLVRRMTNRMPVALNLAVLGQNELQESHIRGAAIRTIYHMPRIPPLVGAGLYVKLYQGRLSFCLTHYPGYFGATPGREVLDKLCRYCLER